VPSCTRNVYQLMVKALSDLVDMPKHIWHLLTTKAATRLHPPAP
jgi:hypothetical protein